VLGRERVHGEEGGEESAGRPSEHARAIEDQRGVQRVQREVHGVQAR
jgi:hypothetical protein